MVPITVQRRKMVPDNMSFRATILGCGSSGGVPRIGTMWGACDSANPKNRRRRCSLLVERLGQGRHTTVLIDSSPDVREQLLAVRAAALDGVLYTHDHADHTHGIDDLRMVAYAMKRRLDAWADTATLQSLEERFRYCFQAIPGSGYAPILNAHTIVPPEPIRIEGPTGVIEAVPVPQEHGDIATLGFRFGGLAYSPDISGIPDASVPLLEGLDVWIVDALRFTPHPSHFSVKQALEWIGRMRPKRAILTHMTTDLDYDALKRELPKGVEPAYDNMEIEF
jgi:phosphoribosyl 1,2-cyclic phosphate phosphodiesterase